MRALPISARSRVIAAAILAPALIALAIGFEARRTAPVRDSMRCLSSLIGAGNRGDLEAARRLCSDRILAGRGLQLAPHGGIVGLPRSIRRDFSAWRTGADVLISPAGKEGIVYRFIQSGDDWKYDGAAGFLRSGQMLPPEQKFSTDG